MRVNLELQPWITTDDDMAFDSHNITREEVADRIAVMQLQESSTYKVVDYMKLSKRNLFSWTLNMDARTAMSAWCFRVVDTCGMEREIVASAMNMLDRFMNTSDGSTLLKDKVGYQLAGMTSLALAMKWMKNIQLDTIVLAEMSNGNFTEEDFCIMESRILAALEWRVCGPTALDFVFYYLALIPGVKGMVLRAILDNARYQTELAVSDYDLVRERPSHVAFAAVLNAMETLQEDGLFSSQEKEVFLEQAQRFALIASHQVEAIRLYLDHIVSEYHGGSSVKDLMECMVDAYGKELLLTPGIDKCPHPEEQSQQDNQSPVCVSHR
eukprot:CAMPEP_0118710570 /NCGR_PEP_ID=MMETSP0800-20121206/23466_1 /TAXON_ID=210618 ORGANISM="Striatella unipunctata, Strain CCMP2910" /NCGR_SAMPLE_ID=MMETSP0800 /ASSEMBLY_ACC=CAM_ASM_000638 /LENGTH=324 /DNA_ID=CAMNT_0006614789 /DNA_START=110 /DNA_END=1084 /DNA_ORIENTATION=+